MIHKRHLDLNVDLVDLDSGEAIHKGVSRFWVLSYVSAMTPAHIGYIIEFLWGQRHAPGDSGEGLFL